MRCYKPSQLIPVPSNEKPFWHSQLKLPGVFVQEACEPHALVCPPHSLLSVRWSIQAISGPNDPSIILTRRVSVPYTSLTYACCLVLSEARGTFTGEATDGVDAQELTVVLFGRALIQIWVKGDIFQISKRRNQTSHYRAEKYINATADLNLCRSFRQAEGCILWDRSTGSCLLCSYTGSYTVWATESTRPGLDTKHRWEGQISVWGIATFCWLWQK